jgi:hypothetical protein
MRKPWRSGIACTSIAALLLAGCTSGSTKDNPGTTAGGLPVSTGSGARGGDNSTLDPKNLITAMFAAVKAAASFHVVGSGKDTDGTPFELDVHFGSGGGSGHFSEGDERFDLAGHGGVIWVKTSAAAWKVTLGKRADADSLAATLAAHWVEVPTSNTDFAQLAQYVDKDSFVTSFSQSAASDSGPFEKSGTAAVDGTPAVVFTDTKDKSKIYVAARGAPLLLKVDGSATPGGGGLALTEYNMPFAPTLPPTGQIVAYSDVVK